MSKLAINVSDELRRKPMIVITVFLAWCLLLVVSIFLMREDYNTSVYGYNLLPTKKIDENLPVIVGLLPMLLQIAFGFWAIEKGNRMAGAVTFLAFVIDAATDIYFKSGNSWFVLPIASIETLALFTLGSEFLFLASIENIAEYLPDMMASVVIVFVRCGDVVRKVADFLSGNDNDNYQQRQRNQQQHQQQQQRGQQQSGNQQQGRKNSQQQARSR